MAGDVRKIFATLDGFNSHLMNHYPPRSLRLFFSCLCKEIEATEDEGFHKRVASVCVVTVIVCGAGGCNEGLMIVVESGARGVMMHLKELIGCYHMRKMSVRVHDLRR
ncbi:hypothetical protein LguiA_019925 [Lonicera macranthoides]